MNHKLPEHKKDTNVIFMSHVIGEGYRFYTKDEWMYGDL